VSHGSVTDETVGIGKGATLTGVHTIVLTVYYWGYRRSGSVVTSRRFGSWRRPEIVVLGRTRTHHLSLAFTAFREHQFYAEPYEVTA
jgi:hypothetical protein